MRSPGLVVMVVAGLAIVGYAFYVLSTPEPPRPRPAKVRPEARDGPGKGKARRTKARRSPSRAEAGTPTKPAASRVGTAPIRPAAPVSGPPPRPKPEISLSEARKQFTEFLDELDRIEAEGTELTSEQWVDYYKRGHDALLPLQQHLDWKVSDEADELRRSNEDLRSKLKVIEPGYTPPPTVPPPNPQ